MAEIEVRLSPPQYTFFNLVKHTIGNDPDVKVLEMKEQTATDYLIQIEVENKRKAQALATILELNHPIGNFNVNIEILNCGEIVESLTSSGEIEDLQAIFEIALNTNCYFESVKLGQTLSGLSIIFVVFEKDVIQFFNDDLSDFYQNFNGVVSHVFKEVLKSVVFEVFVNTSTTNR